MGFLFVTALAWSQFNEPFIKKALVNNHVFTYMYRPFAQTEGGFQRIFDKMTGKEGPAAAGRNVRTSNFAGLISMTGA